MARTPGQSDETKAAVLAALLEGQSVSAVARSFRLSRSTVIRYREAAGLNTTPVEQQKRRQIGELVLDYLAELLVTLAAQQRTFRDDGWLKRQSAVDVATLHGVSADKAMRLLAAMEVDDSPDTERPAAPLP